VRISLVTAMIRGGEDGAIGFMSPSSIRPSISFVPEVVRAIAWKAQVRLCARCRRLMAAGKRQTLITTAIAREMAAFLWAIGPHICSHGRFQAKANPLTHKAETLRGRTQDPVPFGESIRSVACPICQADAVPHFAAMRLLSTW
jgi:hypothetical protein